MHSSNKEYFAFKKPLGEDEKNILKRQLIDEAKLKLNQLPCENPTQYRDTNNSNNINNNNGLLDFDNRNIYPNIADSILSSSHSKSKRRKVNLLTTNQQQQQQQQQNFNNESSRKSPPSHLGLTFVYEWYDNNDQVFGYGCNSNGDACRLQPNISPGLFVVSSNIPVLREVCALHGHRIEVYDIQYKSNNFAVWDLFTDQSLARPCYLVKIITPTVVEATKLYSSFKYNTHSYRFVGVPQYYDVTKQILFELLIRRLQKQISLNDPSISLDYTVPKTVMQWFDKNLTAHEEYDAPVIPIITFDIETVSDDPHRVPTGDAIQDVLYSVSIHHTHTNILYSLIYLPLRNCSNGDLAKDIVDDGYDVVPDKNVDSSNCENRLECFTSEYELLARTMDLLTLGKKLHILLGYNSVSYDIKYLLVRCVFYNIYVQRFIWRNGYSFGAEQMHLDLFRIIVMRYRFKSYTLNEVSRNIMKDSKTGVSAVALRYTFFKMLKTQKLPLHIESTEDLPSIRDTLHYNNADTLLVSKLEVRTRSIDFIINRAMSCQVPLSAMTTNYDKMQYKLWNECFVVGLNLKIFLTTFKSNVATVKCPIASPYSPNDLIDVTLNLSEKLNANDRLMNSNMQPPTIDVMPSNMNNGSLPQTEQHANVMAPMTLSSPSSSSLVHTRYVHVPDKKAKFPGGANFCLGEINADNVQMYDYVTAYPLLMDRKNISDETLTIFPASVLLMLYPNIQNHHQYKTYDYLAHSGVTQTETIILYYQYIYDGLYCGAEFSFVPEELHRRQDSPVIIIWEGRRGVLSEIVAKFNETRAKTKIMRKTLDEAYTLVEERINNLIEQKQLIDEMMVNMNVETGNKDYENSTETCTNTENSLENNAGLFGFDDDDDDDDVGDDDDGDESNRNDLKIKVSDADNDGCDNFNFGCDDDDDNDEVDEEETTVVGDGDDCNQNSSANADDMLFGIDEDEDDDDNDDNDNENENENANAAVEKSIDTDTNTTTINTKCLNPSDSTNTMSDDQFKYEFTNKYITVYENQECVINNEELDTCEDPIKILYEILENITLERSKVSNSYDLQKSLVSSIYGCVGKLIHVVAAGITCMTRNALLASAQYCHRLNYEVLYLDTDSIMITGCNEDLSAELNRRFPHMEMEMKVARKCMFVKRKTYYKFDDGTLKYGQNVNGPNAWRMCVEYFNSEDHISTNDEIYDSFYRFFINVYKRLQAFDKVCPEFLQLFTQNIKTKNEYKTMTVAAKFKMYLAKEYPAIAGSNRHRIYYFLDNTVMMPCLRPELDIKSVDDIRNVNMFKYYQNMFTTIFNLIKFHIRKNNEPYKVTISSKYVLLIMLKAFLDAYESTFVTCLADKPQIDETTNADEIFCKDIYEQTIDGGGVVGSGGDDVGGGI